MILTSAASQADKPRLPDDATVEATVTAIRFLDGKTWPHGLPLLHIGETGTFELKHGVL